MENGGNLLGGEYDPSIMRGFKEDGSDSKSVSEDASGEDQEAPTEERGTRKRKKYHRHTTVQIQELEAFFKECPHPDEKQRLELSRRLSLEIKQVKFWFQNRRTQMKTQLERHENIMLKQQNDKLIFENSSIKEALRNPLCTNCGGPAVIADLSFEEHHLRIENARLKEELARFSVYAEKFLGRPISSLISNQIAPHGPNPGLELAVGRTAYQGSLNPMPVIGEPSIEVPFDRVMLVELANAAMGEFIKKSQMNSPLWVRNDQGQKEVFNHDEYATVFPPCIGMKPDNFVVEASREKNLTINVNCLGLVETLMDVDRWVAMFPCLVARAFTEDVISPGMNGTKDGALQLMHADLQVLSPLIPTRKVRFLRFCKQFPDDVWAVVDMSIDSLEEGSNARNHFNCKRLPSGCIMQAMPNGTSRLIWVEHAEYDESAIHTNLRQFMKDGMGFGALRWLATLQRQCECIAMLMSPPPADISDADHLGLTPVGRSNMVNISQRMVDNFCSGISGSSARKWEKLQVEYLSGDVKVMTRRNQDDPGQPDGLVLSAATSVWLPLSMHNLFDFLRDEQMRSQWDILSSGEPMQEIQRIFKGQFHGNGISLLRATNMSMNESSMLILQETWIDESGSLIVYAPVDMPAVHSIMTGGDTTVVALLPSGFSIVPDGPNSYCNPTIDGAARGHKGSILTVGFQILANTLPSSKLTVESVETMNNLIACTIQKIKVALGYDNDGR